MDTNTQTPLLEFFEAKYKKKLSEDEATDYKNKLIQFFKLLIAIDQKQKQKDKNENKWDSDYPD